MVNLCNTIVYFVLNIGFEQNSNAATAADTTYTATTTAITNAVAT